MPNPKAFWWLNANPKIWKIDSFQQGQIQYYTSHNQFGHKRQKYRHFQQVKAGDWMIGYETSPVKAVKAIFEVVEGLHNHPTAGECFSFRLLERVKEPISWELLQSLPDLANAEPIVSNQGSLFGLLEEEFAVIQDLIDRQKEEDLHDQEAVSRYERADALHELFMDDTTFDEILDTLRYKKNLILQGPPGVGKTFVAKRLAYTLMGSHDDTRVRMVQFHQSYAYEDFIQGLRPDTDGHFKVKNGIFYEFCRAAQRNPLVDYCFIIDEINRGNLSKIFGELLFLIENDKRGRVNEMPLTYSGDGRESEGFFVPENVYLIGTMNTADRSLSMIDYALRRRFAFVSLEPIFGQKFRDFLISKGLPSGLANNIAERIEQLNQTIKADQHLHRGFQIGHSYFSKLPDNLQYKEWYERIIKMEIAPLLREYWFDDTDKAEDQIGYLLQK
jgi:hypothetical protein